MPIELTFLSQWHTIFVSQGPTRNDAERGGVSNKGNAAPNLYIPFPMRIVRWIAIAAGALLLLLVVAIAAFLYYVSTDSFNRMVAGRAGRMTHREVAGAKRNAGVQILPSLR